MQACIVRILTPTYMYVYMYARMYNRVYACLQVDMTAHVCGMSLRKLV